MKYIMTTKVRKKNDNRAILEKLLQNALIEYEDGCAGVEIENDTHYIYMYDRFVLNQDPSDSEYYFAKVITSGKHYESIELTQTEKEFLKTELFTVWQPNYREEQYQKRVKEEADNDDSWLGWAEKEFTYDDFMNYKFR